MSSNTGTFVSWSNMSLHLLTVPRDFVTEEMTPRMHETSSLWSTSEKGSSSGHASASASLFYVFFYPVEQLTNLGNCPFLLDYL